MKKIFNFKLLALAVLMLMINSTGAWAQTITTRQTVGKGNQTTLTAGATYTVNSTSYEYGGAFFNQGTITGTSVTFSGCKVQADGAAISSYGAESGSAFLNLTNATFTKNKATSSEKMSHGGAVENSSDVTATFSGTTSFSENGAQFGAALYNYYSTSTFKGNVTFNANTAQKFITDKSTSMGGGVYGLASTTIFEKDATFTENKSVDGGGGAVAIKSNNGTRSTITFKGKATFKNNYAKSFGGAVDNEYGTTEFQGDALFEGNTVDGTGGAIYAACSNQSKCYLTFNKKVDFKSNSSDFVGGAIGGSGIITFNDVATFKDNYAKNSGGAIQLVQDVTILNFNRKVVFSGNKAGNGKGGAMFINAATVNMKDTVKLATKLDSIYLSNGGKINWDFSTGKTPLLQNFQYVKIEKGSLVLTLNPNMQPGDSLIVATGDFSDVSGKDTLTLTGFTGQSDVKIAINGAGMFYNSMLFKLYTINNKLVLKVIPFSTKLLYANSTWNTKKTGDEIDIEGKTYYINANAFASLSSAIENMTTTTDSIIIIGGRHELANSYDLGGKTLIINEKQTVTVASGKALSNANVIASGKNIKLTGDFDCAVTFDRCYSPSATQLSKLLVKTLTLKGKNQLTSYEMIVKEGGVTVATGDSLTFASTTTQVSLKIQNGDLTVNGLAQLGCNVYNGIKNNGKLFISCKVFDSSISGALTNKANAMLTILGDANKSHTVTIGDQLINEAGATIEIIDSVKLIAPMGTTNSGEIKLGETAQFGGPVTNLNELKWDITNHKSTLLDMGGFVNNGKLNIKTDTEQPVDTAYAIGINAGNINGMKFTLSGYNDETAEIVMDGNSSAHVYYAERVYQMMVKRQDHAKAELGQKMIPVSDTLFLKVCYLPRIEVMTDSFKNIKDIKAYVAEPYDWHGGAAYVYQRGMFNVRNTTFMSNSAALGGAIYNTGIANLKNVKFEGNTARLGGAIYNFNGRVYVQDTVTLATETDTWVNEGYKTGKEIQYAIVNWGLGSTPSTHKAVLVGFEKFSNFGPYTKQVITARPAQNIGTYTIATGDFSNVEGKDKFFLTNADNEEMPITIDGETVVFRERSYTLEVSGNKLNLVVSAINAKIDLAVSSMGKATIYSDKNLVVPAGVRVYGMKWDNNQGKLICTNADAYKAGDILPSEMGYLVEGAADTYSFYETDADANVIALSELSGVTVETATTDVEGTIFTLSNGYNGVGFYTFVGETLKANRAFYNSTNPNTKFYIGMDEAAGVESISSNSTNENMYNLSGMRVNENYKGVVIMNGKKVVK